jgi:hypothetical protein
MPPARDEAALPLLDICERTKAVKLEIRSPNLDGRKAQIEFKASKPPRDFSVAIDGLKRAEEAPYGTACSNRIASDSAFGICSVKSIRLRDLGIYSPFAGRDRIRNCGSVRAKESNEPETRGRSGDESSESSLAITPIHRAVFFSRAVGSVTNRLSFHGYSRQHFGRW